MNINHKRLVNVLNTIAHLVYPHKPDCAGTCFCDLSQRTKLKQDILKITTDNTCPTCNSNMGQVQLSQSTYLINGCPKCDGPDTLNTQET